MDYNIIHIYSVHILVLECYFILIGRVYLQIFCKLHRRPPQKNPHQGCVQEQFYFGRFHTSPLQKVVYVNTTVLTFHVYISETLDRNCDRPDFGLSSISQ